MTTNYKIGWGDAPGWFNFTRDFPAKKWEVYAAQGHADAASTPDVLRSTLGLVTSDPAATPQTVQPLGKFNANSTGNWGRLSLIPLLDVDTDEKITVDLAGTQTLRWTLGNGDHDYLVFLAVEDLVPGLEVDAEVDPASGQLTLTWEGTGVAQEATSVAGPYTDNAAIQSGVPFTPAGSEVYYRIMEN